MEAPAPTNIPNSITCETCRQRWTRTHDTQGRRLEFTPIGYATVYTRQGDEEKYLATARSYTDLRQLISKLEVGTHFSVRLCVFMEIVGTGHYLKIEDAVQVLSEDETTEGLWLAMCEAEPGICAK